MHCKRTDFCSPGDCPTNITIQIPEPLGSEVPCAVKWEQLHPPWLSLQRGGEGTAQPQTHGQPCPFTVHCIPPLSPRPVLCISKLSLMYRHSMESVS